MEEGEEGQGGATAGGTAGRGGGGCASFIRLDSISPSTLFRNHW